MKALICDVCGCVVPVLPESTLIQDVTITRGNSVVLEKDVCLTCLEKLIIAFEANKAVPNANKVAPNANKVAPAVIKVAPAVNKVAPDANKVAPGANKAAKEKDKPIALTCVNCRKEFIPRNKIAKCCSHKCAHENWKLNQKKLKPITINKEDTDLLLKKLKRENPIREAKEPNIYREM